MIALHFFQYPAWKCSLVHPLKTSINPHRLIIKPKPIARASSVYVKHPCMLCCDLRHLAGYATIDTAIPCRISLSLSHSSLLISPTFENMTANWKARFRIRNPSRINKFTWRRVFLSISYKHDMLTWILTQPYQQDPKNVACVDLDFSLVDSSVNSQVIDGTRNTR